MIRPKTGKKRKSGNQVEDNAIGKIDALAFQQYQAKILRAVREDLLAGMTTDQLLKKYEVHAAAALISSMINPATVVAAAERILDRTQGKPTQRTENIHKLEKLSEEELNALLKTQLSELEPEKKEDGTLQ